MGLNCTFTVKFEAIQIKYSCSNSSRNILLKNMLNMISISCLSIWGLYSQHVFNTTVVYIIRGRHGTRASIHSTNLLQISAFVNFFKH